MPPKGSKRKAKVPATLWESDSEIAPLADLIKDIVEEEETEAKSKGKRKGKEKEKEKEKKNKQEDDEEEEYGSDGLGDEADQEELDALPAVEKEAIIYDRIQKRKLRKERLRAKQREEGEGGSRGDKRRQRSESVEAEEDDSKQSGSSRSTRSSRRQKDRDEEEPEDKGDGGVEDSTRDKSKRVLDDLAAQLRKKNFSRPSVDADGDDEDEPVRDTSRRRDSSPDSDHHHRDRSRRAVDDDEKEAPATHRKVDKGPTPLRLKDIRTLQMRRVGLEKLIAEPYLDDFVKGKFVRVTVGARTDGSTAYRVAEIVDVQEKHSYRLAGRDTRKYLLLRHGKAEKLFQMVLVSNHSILQAEFDRWVAEMERCSLPVLSAEEALDRKIKAHHYIRNFVYTPEVVDKIVAANKSKSLKSVNLAIEKSKLRVEREFALEAGDEAAAERITRRLEDIEEHELAARRRTVSSREHALIAINTKANHINTHKGDQIVKREKETGGDKKADPFARKPTNPTPMWTGTSAVEAKKATEERLKAQEAEKKKRDVEEEQRRKKEAWARVKGRANPAEDDLDRIRFGEELGTLTAQNERKDDETTKLPKQGVFVAPTFTLAYLANMNVGVPVALSPSESELSRIRKAHYGAASLRPLHLDLDQPSKKRMQIYPSRVSGAFTQPPERWISLQSYYERREEA